MNSKDFRFGISPIQGWVYIRVQVQETWGPKQPLMDLTFGLKTGPKLKIDFIKLRVFP